MKNIYKHAIAFWFVLLILAVGNAIVRETTYKPWLEPYIGMWSHQISSVTGILLFYLAIYAFLKRQSHAFKTNELVRMGVLWIVMTVVFESWMNRYVRQLTFQQVLETYYFWKGETWAFVLLSLLISPLIVNKQLKKRQ